MTGPSYAAETQIAKPVPVEARAFADFVWEPENAERAGAIVARYPDGRQQSAVMPFLDMAQRQVGRATDTQGWLPVPVIEFVARELGMPYIRAYEVASFYTMYNLAPVGKYHVQVCGTTPCLLRGSDDVLAACRNKGMVKGRTTPDGLFTLTEVECLGACANAPMVQINDDNFEDLDYDRTTVLLEALAAGDAPPAGSTIGRRTSCPEGGPSTLTAMVDGNHDYLDEWAEASQEGAN